MNILEYINKLIEEGYTEDEANETAAYMYTDYHGEEEEC